MSKLQHYLEAIKLDSKSRRKKELQDSQDSIDESRALSAQSDDDLPEGRDIDGIFYITISALFEHIKAEGNYAAKHEAANKWLKAHPEVYYYSGEKPEGGNYQFVLDAVYAAQKAGKKIVIGENLS